MKHEIIPAARIAQSIHLLRGQKAMLDRDLAALYGVETRILNQAVKRNADGFPEDFACTLTREEIGRISQIVTSSSGLKFSNLEARTLPSLFNFVTLLTFLTSSTLLSATRSSL